MAKSNLAVRLVTAGVVAPLLLLTMFLAPPWSWYLIVFVASLLAAHELFGMTHPEDKIAQVIGVSVTGIVSVVLYFYTRDARALLTLFVAVTIVGLMVPLWRLGNIESAAFRVMAGIAGPIYIGVLLTTLAVLRRDLGNDGPGYVLMSLMIAWLGDTGGYFFGRYLGKHKLYEAVSPKKTVEGFCGSVVGSVVGVCLAHFWYLPSIPLVDAVVLALVAGALGQLGDLVESVIKRSTGIKDSGWLVPGHGGILDRIDALLVVSPLVYLYTAWMGR